MKTINSKIAPIVFAVVCMLLFPRQAHAYLDLGTGSFIFQMLIASSLAALYFFKSYLRRAVKLIANLFNRKKDVE